MEPEEEFIAFLESIIDYNPDMIESTIKATECIFESSKKRTRKRKLPTPYKHARFWGGYFPANYSGGVAGVTDSADIGMGGGMASSAGDAGGM